MIMDYVYYFKQKGNWRYYPDMVRQMKNEVGITLLVPTLDSVRYMHILDIHVKVRICEKLSCDKLPSFSIGAIITLVSNLGASDY